MTCHYWKGCFIPGCMGGVRHGMAGCYCERVQLIERNRDLEQENARLQKQIETLNRQRKKVKL